MYGLIIGRCVRYLNYRFNIIITTLLYKDEEIKTSIVKKGWKVALSNKIAILSRRPFGIGHDTVKEVRN